MANRKQRRADKKRRSAEARKAYSAAAGPLQDRSTGGRRAAIAARSTAELMSLVGGNAGAKGVRAIHDEALDELVDRQLRGASNAGQSEPLPAAVVTSLLVRRLDEMWEEGWQPLDVVHVVRREATPHVARVAAVGIEAQIGGHPRRDLLPADWAAQLAELDASPSARAIGDVVAAAAATLRMSTVDALDEAIRAWWTLMRMAHRMPPIGDPPSKWARSAADPARARHDPADGVGRPAASPAPPLTDGDERRSAKALATIRGLLAKAESTTFPAEAEAFAAKAQELMTRYAIDAAMLDTGDGAHLRGAVRSRRIHIDQPYAREKVELLSVVGEVNQVRVVFTEAYAIATVVGFPADLDVTDMLYTSLLVQASRALNEATATAGRGSSPAFKRGFWVAYADRIWERLREARESAAAEAAADYRGALVPVLEARKEAVNDTVESMFGSLGQMSARNVDAQGWYAGRAAADSASLGSTYARLRGS